MSAEALSSDAPASVSATPFDLVDPGVYPSIVGYPPSLLLDGTAYLNLPDRLARSGLTYTCLFGEADAAALAEEAPYLVQLDMADETASRGMLDFALSAEEGAIALASSASLDRQRTHFRKWLSVHLPHAQANSEVKPVLFRFYDPAIMAAFLGTLGPADAAAFFGPVNIIVVMEDRDTAEAFKLTPVAANTPPRPFPPGGLYRVSDTQYAILANVTADAFRDDLFRYLRSEFALETKEMSDDEVRELIDQAIADGEALGDKRQGSLLNLVAIRVLRPDLLKDKFVMDQVTKKHELASDPNQRVSLLMGYMTTDFESVQEFNDFYARLQRFWTGEY